MGTDSATALGVEAKELRRGLADLCARLDPRAVPLLEVCGLWSCFDALERLPPGPSAAWSPE